ncbi:hypothetical protein [Tropicibacter naphthalenivorans]|uniref:Cytochrome C oxidase assembly protein n=1 Tax=Tropicibacter naphthalenivorans TaxID=441103 RepID=A0A0P1G1T7_9RHOB|nr:hypothetical protein [Tropicibacter naphthalenivorans]CUH75743.1 hypothetical protein TRN7648_00596 [Tropicibacter naphthalenivorans]SMC42548.1 hypothetical protein SAMN04488093_101288 [Tropicibacter naphthalenivorans]
MALTKEHELHTRRRSRNVGLGLTLAAFIAIVFGMTFVKVTRGGFAPNPSPVATAPAGQQGGANGN